MPLLSSSWCPRKDDQSCTCRPSSRDTFKRVMSGKLSMRVAILNASWASLKMWDEEWMFFWMDSNTVSSLRTSPATNMGKPNQSKTKQTKEIIQPHTYTYTRGREKRKQNRKHKLIYLKWSHMAQMSRQLSVSELHAYVSRFTEKIPGDTSSVVKTHINQNEHEIVKGPPSFLLT